MWKCLGTLKLVPACQGTHTHTYTHTPEWAIGHSGVGSQRCRYLLDSKRGGLHSSWRDQNRLDRQGDLGAPSEHQKEVSRAWLGWRARDTRVWLPQLGTHMSEGGGEGALELPHRGRQNCCRVCSLLESQRQLWVIKGPGMLQTFWKLPVRIRKDTWRRDFKPSVINESWSYMTPLHSTHMYQPSVNTGAVG